MEILLIEPPPLGKYGNQRSKGAFGNLKTDIRWPPIDLMVIAGYLRKNKVGMRLIDGGGERLSLSQLKARISTREPQIAIINTSTTTIYYDLEVAREIKRIWKHSLVGAIGVHVMALPEETLALSPDLDFVVYSEPEIPLLNLSKTLDLLSTRGLCYRKDGRFIKNAPEPPIQDMDEIGIPTQDLLPLMI